MMGFQFQKRFDTEAHMHVRQLWVLLSIECLAYILGCIVYDFALVLIAPLLVRLHPIVYDFTLFFECPTVGMQG